MLANPDQQPASMVRHAFVRVLRSIGVTKRNCGPLEAALTHFLKVTCSYHLTRTVDTLSIPNREEQWRRRWQRRTPAMEVGLTDHRWTIRELLTTVVAPEPLNT